MSNDHTEGFLELLDTSGVELIYKDAPIPALVSRAGNDAQAYDIDPADCQQVTVSFLKAGVDPLPSIGNYFTDDEGGRYRISARRPNPGRPVAKYICEYSGGDQ